MKPGVYVGEVPEPTKGWSAIVVKLVFPDPAGSTSGVHLTTGVSVTPARLPFPDLPDDAGTRGYRAARHSLSTVADDVGIIDPSIVSRMGMQ